MPDFPILLCNHSEDEQKFQYLGVTFSIPANGVLEVKVPELLKGKATEKQIADHGVATLGLWGVYAVTGDKATDGVASDAALARYTQSTKQWCDDLLKEYVKRTEHMAAVGLKAPMSEDEKFAVQWLKDHGY